MNDGVRRCLIALVAGAMLAAGLAGGAAVAHDANVAASPASGSTIAQPISAVTLNIASVCTPTPSRAVAIGPTWPGADGVPTQRKTISASR